MRISKLSDRHVQGAALSASLLTLLLPLSAASDTALFPVIAVNTRSVTSIVSVINAPGGTSSDLRFTYRHKDSLVGGEPNIQGSCSSVSFTRSTSDGDIVSFDTSGVFNGGQALFGDTNSLGTFDIGLAGPLRAYLLVSNSDNDVPVVVGENLDLTGETIILDIASGAAWGMKAINSQTSETDSFNSGVWSMLPVNGNNSRMFSFPPLNEWTTRFFVTPIGSSMRTLNLAATVNLTGGVYDRRGSQHLFTTIDRSVTCTGALDLEDLMDSATLAAVETGGGWSWFRVQSGEAIVYKLEFVLNNPTYGGTNNNGFMLSGPARP